MRRLLLLVGAVIVVGLVAGMSGSASAVGEDDSPADEGASGRPQMERCSDCAELVKQEARLCRFCRFNPATTVDEVEQLAALRGRGVLTDDEYQAAMGSVRNFVYAG